MNNLLCKNLIKMPRKRKITEAPDFGFMQFIKMIPGPAEYMFDIIAQDIKKYIIFRKLRILSKNCKYIVDSYCKKNGIRIRIQDISVELEGVRILLIPEWDAVYEIADNPKKIIIVQAESKTLPTNYTYFYRGLSIEDHSFYTGEFIDIMMIGQWDIISIRIRKRFGYFFTKTDTDKKYTLETLAETIEAIFLDHRAMLYREIQKNE